MDKKSLKERHLTSAINDGKASLVYQPHTCIAILDTNILHILVYSKDFLRMK